MATAAPITVRPMASEWDEQLVVAEWLDRLGLTWCHVANERQSSAARISQLRRIGLKPGVPDILIFDIMPNKPEYRGVAIELKRSDGGRVSKTQRQWLEKLTAAGWYAFVAPGADCVISELRVLGWG